MVVEAAVAEEPKRKRGRPKKKYASVKISVYLPPGVFDAYCRVAHRADLPLAVALRHVLIVHAPRNQKNTI